jgi:AcrR family transcriptional regulator
MVCHLAGINRAWVVGSAATLADEVGLEQLTLAAVAARLELKLASLYNHVDGLPGLRRALSLHSLRQLHAQLSRVAIGKVENAAVIAVSQAYRVYVLEHPGCMRPPCAHSR